MKHIYKAEQDGHYLSMSSNDVTKSINIHESRPLKAGEEMEYPEGAFVLMIVARPGGEGN